MYPLPLRRLGIEVKKVHAKARDIPYFTDDDSPRYNDVTSATPLSKAKSDIQMLTYLLDYCDG